LDALSDYEVLVALWNGVEDLEDGETDIVIGEDFGD